MISESSITFDYAIQIGNCTFLPSKLNNISFIVSLYNLSANATAVVVIGDDVDLDNMAK